MLNAILLGIGWDALNTVVFLCIVGAITYSLLLLCSVVMREMTDVDWDWGFNLTAVFGGIGSAVWAIHAIRAAGMCATLLNTLGVLVVIYVSMALFLAGAALVGRWRYGKISEPYDSEY